MFRINLFIPLRKPTFICRLEILLDNRLPYCVASLLQLILINLHVSTHPMRIVHKSANGIERPRIRHVVCRTLYDRECRRSPTWDHTTQVLQQIGVYKQRQRVPPALGLHNIILECHAARRKKTQISSERVS